MKKIIFALLTLMTMPAVAQTDVSKFLSGTAEGVTYYLPTTTINITVDAMCITSKPGEFHRYAERYLRLNNVISSDDKYWEIENVDVELTGKPDAEKMFTVKLNNSSASNVHLTNDGIIESINREPATPLAKEEKAVTVKERSNARQYMTEEILQATSTAKMAELVAKEIYAIRESKIAITRGQADNMPKDGMAMQLVLQELDKQEKALMALFTGVTDTLRVSRTVRFTPNEASDTTKGIMFRFSRKLGLVDNANLAGAPVYYDFNNLQSVYIPTPEEVKKKEIKKEGICYNIPGKAAFKIYTGGKVLYEEELPIAQLGTVEVLSKALFNKNATTQVLFDKATGGIISIEK